MLYFKIIIIEKFSIDILNFTYNHNEFSYACIDNTLSNHLYMMLSYIINGIFHFKK